MQKKLRIFLLILIIIGIVLLLTQKIWVPRLVNQIISSEASKQSVSTNQILTPDQIKKMNLIRIFSPQPNETIQSPLTVTGKARGSWFFEASFPVVLVNWDGLIIAHGVAKAKSDWTTTDFVPFEAKLTFTADKKAYSNKGTLILKKDNPSGLSKNDDALEIPVLIKN
jgi:formate-dependent nitrite reductase cytochrome c552 subunit